MSSDLVYKMVFNTKYRLTQVEGSILQYVRPLLSYQLSLRFLFCLFLGMFLDIGGTKRFWGSGENGYLFSGSWWGGGALVYF